MSARRGVLIVAVLAMLLLSVPVVAQETTPPAEPPAKSASLLKLALAYNDVAAPVHAGDELTLVLAVSYGGPGGEDAVEAVTSIPPELSYLAGSAQTDLGTLIHSDTTFTLTLPASKEPYLVLFTYRASVVAASQSFTVTAAGRSSSGESAAITLNLPVMRPLLYLPLIVRNFGTLPDPGPAPLADAPNVCPGLPITTTRYREDFDGENDNDWFTFVAQAGQTYRIETGDLEERVDTLIALYADDCATLLAENDDIDYPTDIASRIVLTATEDAGYCVLVRNYDWRVYGPDTGYTFGVLPGSAPQLARLKSLSVKPTPLPTPVR